DGVITEDGDNKVEIYYESVEGDEDEEAGADTQQYSLEFENEPFKGGSVKVVSVDGEEGYVSNTYDENAEVMIEVSANEGYKVLSVKNQDNKELQAKSEDEKNGTSSYMIIMTENMKITVEYVEDEETVKEPEESDDSKQNLMNLTSREGSVRVGDVVQLSCEGKHQNEKNQRWVDPSSATSISGSNVTFLEAGEVTIEHQYRKFVNWKDCCTQTFIVEDIKAESLSLNKSSIELMVGKTETLVASVQPDTATEKKIWSSSNVNVATVDQNGKVTARGIGEATITVKVGELSKSANVKVIRNNEGDTTTTAYFYVWKPGMVDETGDNYRNTWYYMGTGSVKGPTPTKSETKYYDLSMVISTPSSFGTIEADGIKYRYDSTGTADYTYSIIWNEIIDANGANNGNNQITTEACYHVNGYAVLKKPDKVTVDFEVWEPSADGYSPESNRWPAQIDKGSDVVPPDKEDKVVNGVQYRFDGWYKDRDCERKAISSDFKAVNESVVFYGKYIADYILTYDENGATTGMVPEREVKPAGSKITVKNNVGNLQKAGYVFKGWNTAADGSGKDYLAGAEIILDGNITLYAQWNAGEAAYKVEHYLQKLDGNFETSPKVTENLTGVTEEAVEALPKEFTGFEYDPEAENTIATGVILADGSLVLKLYYVRKTYTVTYDLNGGKFADSTEKQVFEQLKHGKSTPILTPDPTRDGYAFKGWTPEIAKVVTVDATYTAQWEMNVREKDIAVESYIGTYDAEGHTVKIDKAELEEGDKVWYSTDDGATWTNEDETTKFTNVVKDQRVRVKVTNPKYIVDAEAEGTVTITPFEITVKAKDASKTYGDRDPEEFKVEITPKEKPDDYTIGYEEPGREAGENAGFYEIKVTGEQYQNNDNYIVTYVPGTFTINAAERAKKISVESYNGTYDAAGHTVTVNNTEQGDVVQYSLDEGANWVTEDKAKFKDVTYAGADSEEIVPKSVWVKVSNPNYGDDVVVKDGTVTITRKQVTVTAQAAPVSKVYGQEIEPKLSGETSGVIDDAEFVYEVSREEGEAVGTYEVTASGDRIQGNYEVEYVPGTFTITPAGRDELNVESYSGIYDAKEHSIKVIGLFDDDSVTYSWQDESGKWSEPSDELPQFTDVTNGPIRVKVQVTNSNYSDVPEVYGTVNITPFAVKVKAEDASKIYGEDDPEFEAKVISEEAEKNKPADGYTISYNVSREKGEDVGGYTITPSGDSEQGNYIVTYETGRFTINAAQRAKEISVESYAGTYDAAGHTVTVKNTEVGDVVEYSLNGGETWVSKDEAQLTDKCNAARIHVKVTNANYGDSVVITNGTVTITPFEITVKAKDAEKKYGEKDPKFEVVVSPAEAGKNKPEDGYEIRCTEISREEGENVGKYTITPKVDYEQGNYIVTYEPATFTITPADRAELNVESYSGIYDAEEHSIKVIGLLTGDSVTYSWQDESGIWSEPSDELPQFTDVTNGPITVKVQVTNSNYSDVPEVQGTVNITPFVVKVKAEDASKIYGDDDPKFGAKVISAEAGKNKPADGYTIRYKEISREEGEDVGEYTITPSGDSEQGNYIVSYEPGTFTIQAGDRENAVTVTSYEGVYDATGHTVTVKNTEVGDVVEYSLDGGVNWVSEDKAKLTNVVDARNIQVRVTNANYGDSVVITNGTVTITPAKITVTADSKSKKYGETDPIFTYTHSNGVAGEIPVFGGGLVRTEGENVTVTGYEINQGTLSLADNSETGFKADNYMINYVPARM
ncbi:MAG: InlB B-repeat-containing protein, partial [Lachnospiraceae bacterium]|nr:InlB B-repeat-containing protein [Lachnospiraceae bacterium]